MSENVSPISVVQQLHGNRLVSVTFVQLEAFPPKSSKMNGRFWQETKVVAKIPQYRPLAWTVVITGSYTQGEPGEFTYNFGPHADSIHSCKVYDQSGDFVKGVGKLWPRLRARLLNRVRWL